jgi:hypothetical protein
MTDEDAAIIKGMLDRGDDQQWIVAWFGGRYNPGRIADINSDKTFTHVAAAESLPPAGPYPVGAEIRVHRALSVLLPIKAAIDHAIKVLIEEDFS